MHASVEQLIEALIGQAGSTIILESVVWALGGLVFGLVLFFGAIAITRIVLGDVEGPWEGAWIAVYILAALIIPGGTAIIGFGEGALSGAETALRQSDFARENLPAVTTGVVGMYAVVYYTDPNELDKIDLFDLASAPRLLEVKDFATGDGSLETERLRTRLDQLEGENLARLARQSRDDLRKYTQGIGELGPAQKAVDAVFEHAIEKAENGEGIGPIARMSEGLDEAAVRRGDPSTITHAELSEHARERVIIPTIMAPLKALIRPWQWGAGLVAGIAWFFALIFRGTAWYIGVRAAGGEGGGEAAAEEPVG